VPSASVQILSRTYYREPGGGLNLFTDEDDVAAVSVRTGQAEFILARRKRPPWPLGVAQLENGVDRASRASSRWRDGTVCEMSRETLVGTADGGGELIGLVDGQLVDLTE